VVRDCLLDYDFDLFLRADYSVHSSSCIQHQLDELTDIHQKHGGFPTTLTSHNTQIHQLWWDDTQVDYEELGFQLDMEVVTISSIKQDPGMINPCHRDMFYQINKRFPDDTRTKVRANIFLEDWKMGHFLQYDNVQVPNWEAGHGYMWDSTVEHLSANAGFSPKYTLQISGFLLA